MNEWMLIVAGIGLYWALVTVARTAGYLPDFVGTMGPILTIHTKRGRAFLEWVAQPKRFWRAWGNLGLGGAYVVMLGTFFYFSLIAISTIQRPPPVTSVNQPKNFLVIPGVNDFLPLAATPEIVFGLLVGMVVHEGGHGILCRVGNIDIESMGLAMLAFIPIGAFVEPDEDSQQNADRGARARMFAAGVTNNFFLTAIVFMLLFGPVVASISVASGALVAGAYTGSPADDAGFDQGDRITAIDGTPVESNSDFNDVLAASSGRTITVETGDGKPKTVSRSLFVTTVARDSPFAELGVNANITHVNDTRVHTQQEFSAAVDNRSVVSIQTANGTTVTGHTGAIVTVTPEGPLAGTGLDPGTTFVVTKLGDTQIQTGEDLRDAIDTHDPGESVRITGYTNNTTIDRSVTLGEQDDGTAYLGVIVGRGVSGLTVSDFGIQTFPADRYLALLGGDAAGSLYVAQILGGDAGPIGSFVRGIIITLFLPFIGTIDPTLPMNFPGFVPANQGFFTVASDAPLGFLGEHIFLFANLLFWTGWINLNLGFFNCIPAFPLDGGHLLRTGAEALTARLPIDDKRAATRAITTSVGLIMLASLMVMMFGPQLLN